MGVSPEHVTAGPGFYALDWNPGDIGVTFEADRFKAQSNGLQARVRISATKPDGERIDLHYGNLNLAAGRSRRQLSQDLEGRLDRDFINWDQIIEESCRTILEREDEGSPAEYLAPAPHVDVEYLLRPLLLDHLPVLWYAPGGSGKSLVAMYVALLVQNGLAFQGELARQENVLYLDWEVTKEEAARRCTLLARGLEQVNASTCVRFPLYRRCLAPLADDISEISKIIARNKIGLVIVDSAGPACGGDVMSAELALQFFNALRKVTAATNASSSVLTHTTKADRREENQRRLPIGSIYFENLARATWEIRPQETSEERVLRLGLFPRKQNMDRPLPVGMKLTFAPNTVAVDGASPEDALTERGAAQSIILDALSRGPLMVSELADATGATPGTIRTLLWKLKKCGKVENLARGQWGLVEGRGA